MVEGCFSKVGPSVLDAGSIGLLPGDGWLTFIHVPGLGSFEIQHDLILDPDGNLGVLERQKADDRVARVLLDTYLLGDARQSSGATAELERRARDA